MLTKEKITEILKEKYPYLVSKYGVKRIGLFGSYAKGKQTENSDIDIVEEFESPIGIRFVEFAEYLEEVLGRKNRYPNSRGCKRNNYKKNRRRH